MTIASTPDDNSEYCSDKRETADKEQLSAVGDFIARTTEYRHGSDSSILYSAQLSASSLSPAPASAAVNSLSAVTTVVFAFVRYKCLHNFAILI